MEFSASTARLLESFSMSGGVLHSLKRGCRRVLHGLLRASRDFLINEQTGYMVDKQPSMQQIPCAHAA